MPSASNSLLDSLRIMVTAWRDDPRDDAQLLAQFAETHDEAAFATLVWRHGPLVWRTCQRVLGNTPDAEDAFQAAFLALSRKASQLRSDTLAGWLYRVARQAALDARIGAERRRSFERQLQCAVQTEGEGDVDRAESYAVLDEELAGLPERLRVPLVLRYLEAKTLEEVARILGCSRTAVSKRLTRGEAVLRERLSRRGVVAGAGAVATLLVGARAVSAVPTRLITGTARAASAFRSHVLTGRAADAAQAVLQSLPAGQRPAWTGWLLAVACACGLGTAVVAWQASGPPTNAAEKAAATPQGASRPRVDLQGEPLPEYAVARLGAGCWQGNQVPFAPHAVFTPDGKHLLLVDRGAGPADKALHQWDTATRKVIRSFGQGLSRPSQAVLAPDGKVLLAACHDAGKKYVCLWDVGADRERCRWPAGTGLPAAFAPDSRTFVLTNPETPGAKATCSLRLYETASGKEVRQFTNASPPLCAVAFDRGGETLVALVNDGTVVRWETSTGKEVRRFSAAKPANQPSPLLSSDGQTLVVYDQERRVSTWDTHRGKRLGQWPSPTPHNYGFDWALAPDGQSLVVNDRLRSKRANGKPRWTLETTTGKELHCLEDEAAWWNGQFLFAPDGKALAGVHGDSGAIALWDPSSGRELPAPPGHQSVLTEVAAVDGQTVLTWAPIDGTVRLWERNTGRQVDSLRMTDGCFLLGCVAASPDGRTIALGEVEDEAFTRSHLRLWDRLSRRDTRSVSIDGAPGKLAFSPDGRRLAVTTLKNRQRPEQAARIHIWDVDTGKELRTYRSDSGYGGIAFAPDGQRLLTWAKEGGRVVLQWLAVNEDKVLHTLPLPAIDSVQCFSPDGMLSACLGRSVARETGGSGYPIRICNLAAGAREVEAIPPLKAPDRLCFAPDGTVLATGDTQGVIHLWEVATGKGLGQLRGHQRAITALAFTPDGQALVSGSADTTGMVWDVRKLLAPPARATPPTAAELERWWADLGNSNPARAHESLKALKATPDQSIALLRRRIGPPAPPPPPDRERIARLLADLDSDTYAARERAMRELEGLGESALPFVRQALAQQLSLEVRRRLEALLAAIQSVPPGTESGVVRNRRGLHVLEAIGTREACQALQEIAAAFKGTPLGLEAEARMQRLSVHRGIQP